jgi:hypothetical protein
VWVCLLQSGVCNSSSIYRQLRGASHADLLVCTCELGVAHMCALCPQKAVLAHRQLIPVWGTAAGCYGCGWEHTRHMLPSRSKSLCVCYFCDICGADLFCVLLPSSVCHLAVPRCMCGHPAASAATTLKPSPPPSILVVLLPYNVLTCSACLSVFIFCLLAVLRCMCGHPAASAATTLEPSLPPSTQHVHTMSPCSGSWGKTHGLAHASTSHSVITT